MKQVWLMIVLLSMAGCTTTPPGPMPVDNPIGPGQRPLIDYDTGLDGQLASLSQQVAAQLARGLHWRVGMKGFYNIKGRSGRFEKYLEIEFVNRLFRTGMFFVFTPEELSDLDIAEAGKQRTKTLNSHPSSPIPPVAGSINAYLVGSTVELPESVKVSVKLISAKSGAVFGTATVLIHKDSTVESLLNRFGMMHAGTSNRPMQPSGKVVKAGDNQYVELIPEECILYVKQVNYEYSLFSNKSSSAEIFLNDEYRVMKIDDMIALTHDNQRYVLSLRNIIDYTATFTFASLATGAAPATERFSSSDREPFKPASDTAHREVFVEQELTPETIRTQTVSTPRPNDALATGTNSKTALREDKGGAHTVEGNTDEDKREVEATPSPSPPEKL